MTNKERMAKKADTAAHVALSGAVAALIQHANDMAALLERVENTDDLADKARALNSAIVQASNVTSSLRIDLLAHAQAAMIEADATNDE